MSNKYPKEFSEKLKKKIRLRDGYICQKCGEYGYDVHHIDYNKNNCSERNLICLCHPCNVFVNKVRMFWTERFKIKIKEIYSKK